MDKRWHSKVNNWHLVVKTLYEQPLAAIRLANGWRTVGRATVGIATVGIPLVIRLQNYDVQQSLLIGEEVKFHACTSAVFKN